MSVLYAKECMAWEGARLDAREVISVTYVREQVQLLANLNV